MFSTVLFVTLTVAAQPLILSQHSALMDVYDALGSCAPSKPTVLIMFFFFSLSSFPQDAAPRSVLDLMCLHLAVVAVLLFAVAAMSLTCAPAHTFV
jgi:hypothetical protein